MFLDVLSRDLPSHLPVLITSTDFIDRSLQGVPGGPVRDLPSHLSVLITCNVIIDRSLQGVPGGPV